MNFIKLVVQYIHHKVLGTLLLPSFKIPGLVMVVCAYSDICRCECLRMVMLLQLTVISFETTKDFANRFGLGTVYF